MEEQAALDEQQIKAGLAEILAQCEPDRSQLIPILQKEDVKSVTIVEMNKGVMDLVEQSFRESFD